MPKGVTLTYFNGESPNLSKTKVI